MASGIGEGPSRLAEDHSIARFDLDEDITGGLDAQDGR